MHFLLHIDTSGDTGTVAIAADGNVVSVRTNGDTRNQAAYINNMIDEVLAEAGTTIPQLSGVVVCAGPGSYTGLRIGLATAKALCYVANLPLFTDNKLKLLAYQATKKYPGNDIYMPVLQAREKEYFSATYDAGMKEILPPAHIMENDLLDNLSITKRILLIGNISIGEADLPAKNGLHIVENNIVDLAAWAECGYLQYKCNESVNLASVEPFYLKQVYTHNSKNGN